MVPHFCGGRQWLSVVEVARDGIHSGPSMALKLTPSGASMGADRQWKKKGIA